MKKILLMLLLTIPAISFSQIKPVIAAGGTTTATTVQKPSMDELKLKAQEAVTNIAKYYDISDEGTLYSKGTFPRKVDTTKVLVLYSTIDKVTGEDGTEFTSPKVLQKVMYVMNKPNSFTLMDYFDESMKPIMKELIIWQTKEFPKTK